MSSIENVMSSTDVAGDVKTVRFDEPAERAVDLMLDRHIAVTP